jgi:uncharacterized membrane protein (UPF0182 family)
MPDGQGPPDGPQSPFPQIDLGKVDFARLSRMSGPLLLLLALIPIGLGLSWVASFYTDWLWFGSLGYESVLLTMTGARVVLYLLALGVFLALAAPNLIYAFRVTGGAPLVTHPVLKPEAYRFARTLLVRAAAGVTVLAALVLAVGPAAEWETVLLFLNQVPFGQYDPIFGRDFSFFVFTLPAIELVRTWLMSVLVMLMLIIAAFYYLTGRLRMDAALFTGRARTQFAVLAAGIFVLVAVGHWLGRYELLYSPTGAVYGVGYTDNYFNLPGRAALSVIALVSAVLMLAGGLWWKSNRLLVAALALWAGLYLLIGNALPAAVQRLRVEPAELAMERPFLANNIGHTRQAFGLEGLQSRNHPALGRVGAETVEENQGTIQNVRLWDESPLLQSYNQIQFFRLYYDFLAVHTDRYTVDGELRQVMLATRELSAEKLPAEAQRWVNRRLQFTHGYGIAMSPVTEVEVGGRPSFLVSDVPPTGPIPLDRPEVYYGLKSLDYVVVRSGMEEFNYPGPDGPVYTRYDGGGGVPLGSIIRRLLYAWQFRDINLLISGEIEPESRIQYRRTVRERFSTIAPFLLRDREAYSVVADGRLFWIQDAYTVTDRYPYSTPWEGGGFNYIRNSVKAVVDAYDGTVDYYVFDPTDPIIQAYQATFPGLFKSRDEMPEHLRAHIRVPLDQFTVQTRMLLQYHMQDPVVFYNKEDQWSIPVQTSFGQPRLLEPYYIVARLPGETREEFLLIQPFTPNNRHNLVGWMAARSDGERYGEIVLFRFPAGRHVDGPSQVEARIDNDAVISEQFTLWGQVGSEVMRGILLVIPLGDALVYAEPVFLRPETLDFPELRRIILADATTVTMHQTLDASVAALVGELPPVAPIVGDVEAAIVSPERQPAVDALREGLEDVIQRLQELVEGLGDTGADALPQ